MDCQFGGTSLGLKRVTPNSPDGQPIHQGADYLNHASTLSLPQTRFARVEISRKDRAGVFVAYATQAAGQAQKAANPRDRDTWNNIADFWSDLARFRTTGAARFGCRVLRPLNIDPQAFLPTSFAGGSAFRVPITCEGCGQDGTEIWELVAKAPGGKIDAQFVSRIGKFYERISKKAPYPIEVVCQGCESVISEPE